MESRSPDPALNPGGSPSIPDHSLLRLIGRGSYGEVWLARNIMGTYRAVKVVYEKAFQERQTYQREFNGVRQFEPISRLHEGFVDILHIGENVEAGYFYYVMELGDDLATRQDINPSKYHPHTLAEDLATRRGLPASQCLEWGQRLCQALKCLHGHKLIHRDVKPSNIIFVNGTPKLADVGLVSGLAEANSYVGTEGYIPPQGPNSEQADVFSLGRVLYEMCTGHDRSAFPTLPAKWGERPDADRLRELNEIIVKACHNDTGERYPSAQAMLADLNLLDSGRSVYRMRLIERRLAWLKKIALVLLPLLAIGGFYYVDYQNRQAERREFRQRQIGSRLSEGTSALDKGDLLGALPIFAEVLDLDRGNAGQKELHRFRLRSVLAQAPRLVQMWCFNQEIKGLDFSPDGGRLLIIGLAGKARIWEVASGQACSPEFGNEGGLFDGTFSPDGKSVLTAGRNGNAIIWNPTTGERLATYLNSTNVFTARFSPDGKRFVTSSIDRKARIWDVHSQKLLRELVGHKDEIVHADWSPDGRFVVTASQDTTVRVWDAESGQMARSPLTHPSWAYYAQFSPDGQRLVTASFDREARLWQWATSQKVPAKMHHDDGVNCAVFSPDGRYIATASYDETVRLWDGFTGQIDELNPVLRHSGRLSRVAFSPDGHQLATTCFDGTARVWDLAGGLLEATTIPGKVSRAGDRMLQLNGSQCQIQMLASNRIFPSLDGPSPVKDADWSGGGRFALVVSDSPGDRSPQTGQLRVWNLETGQFISPSIPWSDPLTNSQLSGAGQFLAVFHGHTVRRLQVSTGMDYGSPLVHATNVSSMIFSPDEQLLAASSGNLVYLWKMTAGENPPLKLSHPLGVRCVDFSPNSQFLVTGYADGSLSMCQAQVWNSRTGEAVGPPLRHRDGVLHAAFSPDGKKVVTGSEDFSATIWNAFTGQALTPNLRHKDQVLRADFSQDGRMVVTVCADWTVRVWDAETGLPLTPPIAQFESPIRAALLNRGQYLVTTSREGINRRWDLAQDPHLDADWDLFARLLSSSRPLWRQGALRDVPEPLAGAWRRLRANYPDHFLVKESQIVDWHVREAFLAERNEQWSAVFFHLKRSRPLRPADESLLKLEQRAQQALMDESRTHRSPPETASPATTGASANHLF